ncbi:hypothetical protein HK101_003594 [Irineochytrium annulatum]|nr:hypothetical protein HK101_003594 [Irineochytrium annulatum]
MTTVTLPQEKAQCVIAIFEDAMEQLQVLGDISPDLLKTEKPSGEEITRILRDQRALEARFQDLLMDQEKLKSLPNKSKYKEGQLAITDVTNELQRGTQCEITRFTLWTINLMFGALVLARNLKAHPSVAQNLMKIQTERSTLQALISKTVRELREHRFESLLNTVEEEKRKRNTLQNTINRENEASELQRELQKELANERKLLEEETNDRNQVIQQLKDTIQEINALTNSEQKYIKKETKAHENSVRQRCQARELNLSEDQSLKNKCLAQESRAHEKIVDYLSRQRKMLETQIQDWMTKYEEDTESKANELDSLKQKRSQDLDKFEELVAAYEDLEKIVEEDRQNKQREAEERRVMHERISAAALIQRWWRRNWLRIQKASSKNQTAKKPAKGKGGKGGAKGAKKGGSAKKKK